MIAASTLAILIVPVLFVIITRFSYWKKKLAYLQEHHEELMEKARKVELQNIDPELEYEITQNKDRNWKPSNPHRCADKLNALELHIFISAILKNQITFLFVV